MSSCSGAQEERVRILDEMRKLAVITCIALRSFEVYASSDNNCRPKEFTSQIGYP
jgi:hypothetical protein